jgi:hypothetical protein
MDQSYPEPFAGGAELQPPARRPRLSTLFPSSANKPVGGHQDLPTGGHEDEATATTESERIPIRSTAGSCRLGYAA